MGERDGRADGEGGNTRGDGARAVFTNNSTPCDRCLPCCIAWNPRQPCVPHSWCKMTQRNDTTEAQLKSRIGCDRGIINDHPHCGERKYRITVPVSSQHGPSGTQDCHQRRALCAGRRCHDKECARGAHHHASGDDSGVSKDNPRNSSDDPTKDSEVETRDRENVREPARTECILNLCVAFT